MTITSAEQILVIILAVTLALFLVLAIVVVIEVIQILKGLKRISAKAEKVVDSAEAVGEFFKKAAAPATIGRLLSGVIEGVREHKHKTKED